MGWVLRTCRSVQEDISGASTMHRDPQQLSTSELLKRLTFLWRHCTACAKALRKPTINREHA